MGFAKIEVERFDGKGDFSLWRQRMKAVLVQMKISKALQGDKGFPESTSSEEKQEALDLAYSTLILHLGDRVLREVSKETTAAGIWLKLESLYMTKSLSNRVLLKGKLFGFKIPEDKPISESLDEFNRLIIDLANIEIKIEDEDQAIMILNALPKSYSTFVEAMKYAKESLSLEDVQAALKANERESRSDKRPAAESLNVRGRSEKNKSKPKKRQSQQGKNKEVQDDKEFPYKCYHCHEVGHMKKDCPNKDKTYKKEGKNGNAAIAEDQGYESAEALNICTEDSSKI